MAIGGDLGNWRNLMSLSQSIHQVVDLAREVRAYYDRELPRYHPDYPLVNPHEEEPPAPPVEHELRDYLASLPGNTVYALLTLADSARWGSRVDDLAASYETMKATFPRPEEAADEMLSHVPLGDYLADVLEELQNQGIDIDALFRETSPTS